MAETIDAETLAKMRRCAPLLPDPGPEVVVQLLDHIATEGKRHGVTIELLRQVVMDFGPDCSDGCVCSANTARKHLAIEAGEDPDV
jgi:hypothetical protein